MGSRAGFVQFVVCLTAVCLDFVVGRRSGAPFVWGLARASSCAMLGLQLWSGFSCWLSLCGAFCLGSRVGFVQFVVCLASVGFVLGALSTQTQTDRHTHTQTHRDRHRDTDTDRHRHRHTETQRHKGTSPRRRRMKLDALQSGGPSGASDEVNSCCHFQRSNWVTSACSLSLWWVCCNEQPRVVGAPCKAALGNLLHQNVCQSVRPNAPQHVRQSVRQNARRRNTLENI